MIRERESILGTPTNCSILSSQPRQQAWAWGWRSAVRLSKLTVGGCGQPRTTGVARPSTSLCRYVELAEHVRSSDNCIHRGRRLRGSKSNGQPHSVHWVKSSHVCLCG